MKQIIILITIICVVGGIEGANIFSSKTPNASGTISAMHKGKKAKVTDSEKLFLLTEEYANIGIDRMLNEKVTDYTINQLKKSGLYVSISFPQKKMMKVSGCQEEMNVEKIYILEDDYKWLVVCLEDAKIVLALRKSEMAEIRSCIEINP